MTGDTISAQPPRRLVIFADGTGNAFTTQESNVWRIYQALDRSDPDQLPCYIKGVGTSGFKPFAYLDGATGIGVPSNVRKLYEFICWNWREGTELYLFGFSRGAFTIRTLVGMIHHEGIIPRSFGGQPVARAEMRRNVMAAWRHYRGESFETYSPTIVITRWVRDRILTIYQSVLKHRSYSAVRAEQSASQASAKISFVGLFDTVEAYGVPIEELRRAIDVTIWPISFRNYHMSDRVERACHALALDDERTTFHPLQIERTSEEERERIKEVWFAGVHSDVGGGYPDGQLSYEPLCWIIDNAAPTDGRPGLRFERGIIDGYRNVATPLGPRHDSRSGLAVMYRYDPRTISADDPNNLPVIHHSVAEKIAFGSDQYAPIMLPGSARVLMPDGNDYPLEDFNLQPYSTAVAARTPRENLAISAVSALMQPSRALISLSHDYVWWRRVFYFCLLISVIAIALLPWTAELIAKASQSFYRQSSFFTYYIEQANNGLSSLLTGVFPFLAGLLPSWVGRWTDVLAYWPLPCLLVIVLAVIFYMLSGTYRDSIADLAYQAWIPRKRDRRAQDAISAAAVKTAERAKKRAITPTGEASNTFTRAFRRSALARGIHWLTAKAILPTLAIFLIFVAALVSVTRLTTTFRDGSGSLCKSDNVAAQEQAGVFRKSGFTTRHLCWPSGVTLKEGRSYRLWIVPGDELFADTAAYPTTVAGFKSGAPVHLAGSLVRRWFDSEWFQPIGRIGNIGNTTWPLVSEDGDLPGVVSPPPSDAARRKAFVSTFTAKQDGEFFLYVNDAIVSVPLGPTFEFFYQNNIGNADIYIQEVPTQPLPNG